MPEDNEKIGSVSPSRCEQIVTELREVVDQHSRGQFTISDRALEIEPSRPRDGIRPESGWSVRESLTRLAEDIGLKYSTVNNARWVAARWPREHRQKGVPFTVYRILASIENETERFTLVKQPRAGKPRWTADDASRVLGWQVENPVSKQEKISAIHALAQDEEVAAVVTTDLLRRPAVSAHVAVEDRVRVVEEFTRDEPVTATVTAGLLRRPDVAFRAMSDDTARHQVNHAQVERGRQARENFERTSPVAPAVKQINRTVEFLDLVTACHSFVAAAGRAVPGLRDRQLTEDEQAIVHQNIAKVRATLDWIENAVDTSKVDMDDELSPLFSEASSHAPRLTAPPGRRRSGSLRTEGDQREAH